MNAFSWDMVVVMQLTSPVELRLYLCSIAYFDFIIVTIEAFLCSPDSYAKLNLSYLKTLLANAQK